MTAGLIDAALREERARHQAEAFGRLRHVAAYARRSEAYAAHLDAQGKHAAAREWRASIAMLRRVTRSTIGSDKR